MRGREGGWGLQGGVEGSISSGSSGHREGCMGAPARSVNAAWEEEDVAFARACCCCCALAAAPLPCLERPLPLVLADLLWAAPPQVDADACQPRL